jgi:hypothetical protein
MAGIGLSFFDSALVVNATPYVDPPLPVMADLLLHIDFSDAATVFQDTARTTPSGIGDSIGGVTDKSGTSNHLIQATASLQPVYAAGPGGRNVSDHYHASNYPFLALTSRLTTARTIFLVGKERSNYGEIVLGDTITYHFFPPGGTAKMFDPAWCSADISVVTVDGTAYNTTTAPSINNVDYRTVSIESTGNLTLDQVSKDRASTSSIWRGHWAEIVIYSSALSAPDLALVTAYLKNRWGTA